MSILHIYSKGQHPLLWAGLGATYGKTTISGTPNSLNYCLICIVYAYFANVAHVLQVCVIIKKAARSIVAFTKHLSVTLLLMYENLIISVGDPQRNIWSNC
jgi:hypothetical protein